MEKIVKIFLFLGICLFMALAAFSKDYQLEMAFPKEWKINTKNLKIKCNQVIRYKYYILKGKYKFVAIPVLDNNGNMIKC